MEGNQKFRHIFFPFVWKKLTWTQNGLHSGDMSHCELPLTLPVATATVKRCHVEKIRLPHTKRHNGRTLLFSMESFRAFVESCRWRKGDLTAGKLNIKRCARGAVFTSDLYVKSWRPSHTLNLEQNSNINIKRPWTMTSGGNLQPNRAKDTRYDIDMKSPAKQVYWADRRAPGKASQSLPRSRSRPRSRWYCPPSPLSPPPVPAHSTNNCAPAPPSKEPGPPCVSIFGILPTQPLPRAPPACVFSF